MKKTISNTESKDYKARKKVILLITIMATSIILFSTIIMGILRRMDIKRQETNNNRFFTSAISNLEDNIAEEKNLENSYDNNNKILLNNLVKAFSGRTYLRLSKRSFNEQINMFKGADLSMFENDCIWFFVLDEEGNVLLTSDDEYTKSIIKTNPDDDGIISKDEYELLKVNTSDYIKIRNTEYIENTETTENEALIDPNNKSKYGKEIYLYCKPIPSSLDENGLKYVFLGFGSVQLDQRKVRLLDYSNWLDGSTIGNNGIALVVDKKTNNIKYSSNNNEWAGIEASKLGLTIHTETDFSGFEKINKLKYFVSSKYYSSDFYGDNYIVAMIPVKDLFGGNLSVLVYSLCLFLITIILVVAYASFARSEMIKNKEDLLLLKLFGNNNKTIFYSRALGRKVVPIALASLLIMFGAIYYIQSLMKLTDAFVESLAVENYISSNIKEGSELSENLLKFHEMQYAGRAQLLSFLISFHGEKYFNYSEKINEISDYRLKNSDGSYVIDMDDYNNTIQSISNSEDLKKLCEDNAVDNIYIISDTGYLMATSSAYTNFRLSENENDQSYAFWDIISGKSSYIIQDAMISDNGEYCKYIGWPFMYFTCQDDDGNTSYVNRLDYSDQVNNTWEGNTITKHRGVLQIEINPEYFESLTEGENAEYILKNTQISNEGFLIGFEYSEDDDIYNVICSSSEDIIQSDSDKLGIKRSAFEGDYNGFQRINGIRYLQSIRKVGKYYIATAMPLDELYSDGLNISIYCVIIASIAILSLSYFTVLVFGDDNEELKLEGENPLQIFGHIRKRYFKSKQETRTTHVKRVYKKSDVEKFEELITNSILILGFLFLVAIFSEAKRYGDNSAIVYILSGSWERGVHLFSISACAVIMMVTAIGLKIFSYVVKLGVEPFGSRSETLVNLITAIIKAGVVVGAVFYCLYLFGINAGNLLASAGIISVVVGLGAQSLISDLLAGVIIVMEGSIHVGDYIFYEDFRGIITEIGLRTTKFEDTKQNVKIVCNSQLKSLVNMSKKYTFIEMNVPVPYNEDIEAIKYILNAEFLDLYTENKMLKGVPRCQGIQEFSESSIDIRVKILCDEKDRTDVERYMHDQLYRIFRENNITIPFNQLDVHFDSIIEEGFKRQNK